MSRTRRAPLYSAAQVRELDRQTIERRPVSGYALMCEAAAAAWSALRERRPQPGRIDIVCGRGNNGGDGYALARLARREGWTVRVWSLGEPEPQTEAAQAIADWRATGPLEAYRPGCLEGADLIVDAVFGIGLSRAPQGAEAAAIAEIVERRAAAGRAYVLAIDIPSGLAADTGRPLGAAVKADLTVSFIGRKLGLYTGAGPEFAGERVFAELGAETGGTRPLGTLMDAAELAEALPPRARDAHKGRSGHALLVGGDEGYAGAILLAARAALRAGAGLVSVATRSAHAGGLVAAQPEAMFRPCEDATALAPLAARAQAVAIGPGLARQAWGRDLFSAVLARPGPLVIDADGLNWLAQDPRHRDDWVLTPHPGEAARLLGTGVADVEADRLAAVTELQRRYGGVVVLKGAGTLVYGRELSVCPYGNPGMAVGGMGDVLTGLIAAFLAQGLEPESAAGTGVLVHALAGDRAARAGERGLLPGDLINEIRGLVNP